MSYSATKSTQRTFSTRRRASSAITLPLIVGSILLAAFVYSVGWFKALFARQPVSSRWWMSIAPVAIVAAIVLRFLGIPYGDYGRPSSWSPWRPASSIGFAEEILTAASW